MKVTYMHYMLLQISILGYEGLNCNRYNKGWIKAGYVVVNLTQIIQALY